MPARRPRLFRILFDCFWYIPKQEIRLYPVEELWTLDLMWTSCGRFWAVVINVRWTTGRTFSYGDYLSLPEGRRGSLSAPLSNEHHSKCKLDAGTVNSLQGQTNTGQANYKNVPLPGPRNVSRHCGNGVPSAFLSENHGGNTKCSSDKAGSPFVEGCHYRGVWELSAPRTRPGRKWFRTRVRV